MLKINSANHHICSPDWYWDTSLTSWRDTDLWYISRGSGSIKTPHGIFPLFRGECFFLKGNERYIASQNPESNLHVFAIHFDSVPEISFSRTQARDPEFLDTICSRIIENRDKDENHKALFWLEAAFKEIEESRDISRSSQSTALRIAETIRKATEKSYINVSVEDMARWFGSSREHFSRLFLHEKGVTARDFILSKRIAMACSLLLSSNYSIGMISDRLGYSDVSFFSRQFKEKMSISPSRYRSGTL